ncbi:unnamed protein product [Kluyveromyces dobzhanskii CBS 2104]|uniref:tRNA-splicing endonuclease subunit Sen2 n=1 Tax=Kluyveromyces dobzhanskii CBS 2104 TaxID=1427455 RepID=A0A0A8LDH6_9SACH|nr:unnamed protein product [Kluyveromyces dobzhanskii CBS 2104]
MAKRSFGNRLRYKHPLPIEADPVPSLWRNPVQALTWIMDWAMRWKETRIIDVSINQLGQILVCDAWQMKYLWEHGFFGTGQLSRSEPNWQARTMSRLQLEDGNGVNLEAVTDARRRQRLEFKKLRAEFEAKKLKMRQMGIVDEQFQEQERVFLKEKRDKELAFEGDLPHIRETDLELIEGNTVVQLEKLQLLPVEAIFLTYAIPVLRIQLPQLLPSLISEVKCFQDIKRLLEQYVAYHHYRSKGWCVRSGIKFGCDLLLYRRGPPFQHAEYGIMVLDANQSNDYTWYSSAARVVGGAKKQLVLCYVELLVSEEDAVELWNQGKYHALFSSCKIHELLYKRWVAGKNRD